MKEPPTGDGLSGATLGDVHPKLALFPNLDNLFAEFDNAEFRSLPPRTRFGRVSQQLLLLIDEMPEPAFLLGAVVDYIQRVNQEALLSHTYALQDFEFWLNHFSDLSPDANYRVRAKIAGKHIPRDDYQSVFPVGMGKSYFGSHFVSAHLAPDIDTTIASFWGWLDAFAARVSEGLHIWYLPGGAPESYVQVLFQQLFGERAFSTMARRTGALSLSARDLITRKGMLRKGGDTTVSSLDHAVDGKAIIVVDDEGNFLNEWRVSDVEGTRRVVTDFLACLRWFENSLHVELITLFAQPSPHVRDVRPLLSAIFDRRIADSEPMATFTERQRNHLDRYLRLVLGIPKGAEGTFGELSQALHGLSITEFGRFETLVNQLADSPLFDDSGALVEDRPTLFDTLQAIIRSLDNGIVDAVAHLDRLDMMIAVKRDVLQRGHRPITLDSDVEEIRQRMHDHHFLTVVVPQGEGRMFPVGVIDAVDLRRPRLGTVTLRDFSNPEETRLGPYLEIISIIDHHKAAISTNNPPLTIIGDAQSSSVLVAEQAFAINDRYSIATAAGEQENAVSQAANLRIERRKLTRRLAQQQSDDYYVHPIREYTEYFYLLLATLDDTDLLAKVSQRDVLCTAELLNRMKSLSLGCEVEVVHFDDIPRDQNFTSRAAERLLCNEELYSIYKRMFDYRERSIAIQLSALIEGKGEAFFADTKEQGGASRVGQTKIFASNYPTLAREAEQVRERWLIKAKQSYEENPSLDLHIQMISTITGAEEVYHGGAGSYKHRDELWLWCADSVRGREHLASFLASFGTSKQAKTLDLQATLCGPNAEVMHDLLRHNCPDLPIQTAPNSRNGLPIVVLTFEAGKLNSRKAMISPHLPISLSV